MIAMLNYSFSRLSAFAGTLLLLLLLSACTETITEPVSTQSEDGAITLVTTGSRSSSLDPFQVTIHATWPEKDYDNEIKMEIYASELNEQTVIYDWITDRMVRIIFKLQDGTNRQFVFKASDSGVSLQEV